MRLSVILPVALAALAGCTPPRGGQPAPAQTHGREGILLAASAWDEGGYGLEPVALLTRDGLRDPWEVEEDSTFNARYYAPGARYAIRIAGVPMGEAIVVQAVEPACSERMATAEVSLTAAVDARWEGLASDAFGAAPDAPLLRAATPAEKLVLSTLADSIQAARGASADHRRTAVLERLFAVTVPGAPEPVLVGSSRISFEKDGSEHVQAVMVVAERREGADRPAYVFHADETEGDMLSRELLDAADVDGDGVPELVARNMYYEGWTYTILRRGPGGWTEIYQGGGGGC
jgi:hypothetical protein